MVPRTMGSVRRGKEGESGNMGTFRVDVPTETRPLAMATGKVTSRWTTGASDHFVQTLYSASTHRDFFLLQLTRENAYADSAEHTPPGYTGFERIYFNLFVGQTCQECLPHGERFKNCSGSQTMREHCSPAVLRAIEATLPPVMAAGLLLALT